MILTCFLPHPENEHQWSVNDFLYLILVIYKGIACEHPKMRLWPSLEPKMKVPRSVPHAENEHQLSVSNMLSCIQGNQTGNWLVNIHK
jgi:hypothetical protein